ncbi:unnamed protein product [Medioppia subpectinata]|uniref:Fanconi-associated nuclease n=1 Tax=Medioppia subpectinata TaxID=1979941 RepID=A0A7R9KRS9_9ACAR|nr:unnamed protein product [Medioppia subpectinata]CAG2108622.1 unnamed protein product [Medioppia subpectinata]
MNSSVKRKQKSILDYFNKSGNNANKAVKRCEDSTPNGNQSVIIAEKAFKCVDVLRDVSNEEFIDLNQFLEIDFTVEDKDKQMDTDSDQLNDDSNEDSYMKGSYVYHNFRQMIDFVLNDKQYSQLFDANDMNVVQVFTCLSGLAQMLLMRLFIRKKHWIRKNVIKYPEIAENLQPILKELVDNQFLFNETQLTDLKESLDILDTIEVKKIGRSLNGMNMNGLNTKKNIIPAILKYINTCQSVIKTSDKQSDSVTQKLLKSIRSVLKDKCFKVNEKLCEPFERMFLLFCQPDINEDDLNTHLGHEFFKQMKAESGREVYPKFVINGEESIYKTRDQLILYSEAFKLEIEILSAIEKRNLGEDMVDLMDRAEHMYMTTIKDKCDEYDILLPSFLRRYTAGQSYIRCLSHSFSVYEQKKNYSKAVYILKEILLNQSIYCSDMRGYWFERLALDLDKHLKDTTSSLVVIEKALSDSFVRTGHRLALYKRQRKIQKSVKNNGLIDVEYENIKFNETTIFAESFKCLVNDKTERKNFFKTTDSNGDVTVMSVEDIVIKHYKSNGFTDGIHTESRVYHTILVLLFWDIIYMCDTSDVSDAFRFQYQRFPLDFNCDQFFIRRKTQITSLLNTLKNLTQMEMNNILENSWNSNFGTISLINWEKSDINQIKEIATCFGSSIITDICERLIKDYRHTRSGFPDLLVWNTTTKHIKAVEVKGPNDKPSNKQLLWLSYLQSIGADVELCHVKVKKSLHLSTD